MGNPHAVIFVEDTKNFPIEKIGPLFERHEMFPERVNTEFVKVLDRENINMRVWERGSGEDSQTYHVFVRVCLLVLRHFFSNRGKQITSLQF